MSGTRIGALFTREYLPFAGWLITWLALVAAIGHADAARLFAAFLLARSARALTQIDCVVPMRQLRGASAAIIALCRKRAAIMEAVSVTAEATLLVLIAFGLTLIGQDRAAQWALLLLIGIPARHLLFLARARRPVATYKIAASWAGALLAAGLFLAKGNAVMAAGVLVLREWVALLASIMACGEHSPERSDLQPFTWRQIGGMTGERARRRLTYRIGKTVLGAFLGPFSGLVARTGRGVGIHKKAEHFVPTNPLPLAILASGAAILSVLLQVALAKPATLIVSASLLRIAAIAGNILLWSPYGKFMMADETDEDDED